MAHGQGGLDPGSRVILEEMRGMRVEMRADRARSDERFERVMRDTQKVFKEIRTVGLAIAKTLNRHTRILEHHGQLLERIDRKLGARGNGRPGPKNGRDG